MFDLVEAVGWQKLPALSAKYCYDSAHSKYLEIFCVHVYEGMSLKPEMCSVAAINNTLQIGLIKGLLYMVAQSIGAILGAGILRVLVPASSVRGDNYNSQKVHH